MKKSWTSLLMGFFLTTLLSSQAYAAYISRFDAMVFDPTVDGGPYLSVYDTQTLDAWQGHMGFSFDYANRPLQFSGTGAFLGQRQSVIDHMLTLHTFGSLGFTDWFTAGLRVPIVLYNWFYSDEPVAAPSGTADKGAMMGDMEVVLKFRLVDIDKHRVGLAFIPRLTLPTGDPVRYTGSGNLTGGGSLAVEFEPVDDVLSLGINAGAIMRDEATRFAVTVGPQVTYGLGVNYQFHKNWAAIAEAFGSTTFDDFFGENTTPLEAGGGIRHTFGDSGFSLEAAGTAGILDGVGSPRFRGILTLGWTSSQKAEPITPQPAPVADVRIQGNKIILWGSIFFDTDRATIKPISYPVLNEVVDVLNSHPEITLVEVQGHTDNRASDAYNLRLSQDRATSALNYLVNKGIMSGRLSAVGYGESQPIATNSTPEGMSQNRRTEFVIKASSDPSVVQQRGQQMVPQQVAPSSPVSVQQQPQPHYQASSGSTPSNTQEWPNFSQ